MTTMSTIVSHANSSSNMTVYDKNYLFLVED
jgi:hypothetical protein